MVNKTIDFSSPKNINTLTNAVSDSSEYIRLRINFFGRWYIQATMATLFTNAVQENDKNA